MKLSALISILLLAGWISVAGARKTAYHTNDDADEILPAGWTPIADSNKTAHHTNDDEDEIHVKEWTLIVDSSKFVLQVAENDDYIARNMLEHTIVNKSLKDELIRYDNRFKDYEEAQGKGLRISLEDISPDSIVYHIGYTVGLNWEVPVLTCEPVNGKPVTLSLSFFRDEFQLSDRKAIELLKHSSPKEYETHKRNMIEMKIINGRDTLQSVSIPISDFVSLRLVYDRDHNLIRRDTLGGYEGMSN